MKTVVLGRTYRDKVFGFAGIATAHTKFLTGCARISLSVKDGNEIRVEVFDITQLDPVSVKEVKEVKEVKKPKSPKGGPGEPVPKKSIPTH